MDAWTNILMVMSIDKKWASRQMKGQLKRKKINNKENKIKSQEGLLGKQNKITKKLIKKSQEVLIVKKIRMPKR